MMYRNHLMQQRVGCKVYLSNGGQNISKAKLPQLRLKVPQAETKPTDSNSFAGITTFLWESDFLAYTIISSQLHYLDTLNNKPWKMTLGYVWLLADFHHNQIHARVIL